MQYDLSLSDEAYNRINFSPQDGIHDYNTPLVVGRDEGHGEENKIHHKPTGELRLWDNASSFLLVAFGWCLHGRPPGHWNTGVKSERKDNPTAMQGVMTLERLEARYRWGWKFAIISIKRLHLHSLIISVIGGNRLIIYVIDPPIGSMRPALENFCGID